MSISLCGPGVKHVWRYINTVRIETATWVTLKGQWQCDDCKTVRNGRRLTLDELEHHLRYGQEIIEQNTEIP